MHSGYLLNVNSFATIYISIVLYEVGYAATYAIYSELDESISDDVRTWRHGQSHCEV